MPSIIIPARNSENYTSNCLKTVLYSVSRLNLPCEFILIDDASEPDENILRVFTQTRNDARGHEFKIVRSPTRQHYSGVFSIGLNLATRDPIFFISNDMMVTPSFLATLHGVSILSDVFGIVRGTSNFADSHPEHQIVPASHPKNYEEVERFSRARAERDGVRYSEDDVLSGDAILLKRSVVDRIGVLDVRFFGYFGDVDYGLRAQLAGFKLVCAKGAWLYHHGAGHVQRETERSNGSKQAIQAQRMELVEAGYQQFRQKWNIETPETYRADAKLDFRGLARASHSGVSLKYETPKSFMENLQFH